MWKLRTKIPGQDKCPTMKFKLISPIPLDPVPIGNTFELQGLRRGFCDKQETWVLVMSLVSGMQR